jgi:hypothetical protein
MAMNLEQIVDALIQERDRIQKAIEALGGSHPATRSGGSGASRGAPANEKRKVSAAARKRMAEAQKKRWAALKHAK